jgi:hypothetical protein
MKAVAKAYAGNSDYELGKPKEGGYFIALKVTVQLDKLKRTVQGVCKWEVSVIEHGQRKMFPKIQQMTPATATVPGINPDELVQGDVDDAVAGCVEAEVTGILKKLP